LRVAFLIEAMLRLSSSALMHFLSHISNPLIRNHKKPRNTMFSKIREFGPAIAFTYSGERPGNEEQGETTALPER
jgi:hypothetical protein